MHNFNYVSQCTVFRRINVHYLNGNGKFLKDIQKTIPIPQTCERVFEPI